MSPRHDDRASGGGGIVEVGVCDPRAEVASRLHGIEPRTSKLAGSMLAATPIVSSPSRIGRNAGLRLRPGFEGESDPR